MFVYPNIQSVRCLLVVFVVSAGFFLLGCGGDQTRDNQSKQHYIDESSAVFAPEPDRSASSVSQITGNNTQSSALGGWSIVLSTVGQGGMERAKQMLQIVHEDTKLKEAYIDERSSGLVIAYGRYVDKTDPQAIKDLKRIQKTDLMGVKVFEDAIIAPPTSKSLQGSNQLYDLRTVKERYGKGAVYTLQIGLYGRADYQAASADELAEFRKAAEAAVRELRAQGTVAFYYHAPARSMVTVGVLSERDFDATTNPPTQSLELRKLREQFPHNLLNGQGIHETVRTESGRITRLQSSQLVGIPDH